MANAALVLLVVAAVLIARGYARSRAPGDRITFRDRTLVVLKVIAVGGVALSATVVFGFKCAPEVTLLNRGWRALSVVGIGLAPLLIYLFTTWALCTTRHYETAWRTKH